MLFVSNLGDVILLKNQKKNIIKGQRIFRFCGLSIKKKSYRNLCISMKNNFNVHVINLLVILFPCQIIKIIWDC